jgi:hypothetical protein
VLLRQGLGIRPVDRGDREQVEQIDGQGIDVDGRRGGGGGRVMDHVRILPPVPERR